MRDLRILLVDDLSMDAVVAAATGYVLKQIGSDDLARALESRRARPPGR